jgi:SPP1 family predicted phage head-tail adaptor
MVDLLPPLAGQLDRLITLQQRSVSQDTAGQRVETWSSLAVVWARQRTQPGREPVAADAVRAEALVLWTIRYRSDVDASMRVLFEGRIYAIQAPPREVHGRRAWLELACAQGVTEV